MEDETWEQELKREMMQLIQEFELCQQRLLTYSFDEIKSMIGEFRRQQSEIFTKQKLVDLTEGKPFVIMNEVTPWGRSTKLEFPKFSGEDLDSWLLWAECFFNVGGTALENSVKVVALHLEGKALQWHQGFIKTRGDQLITWQEYVWMLSSRVGSLAYDDPLSGLRNLR